MQDEDINCRASVVSCIDFRIQETLEKFFKENKLVDNSDRIELAGGVKDAEEVVAQLQISHRLHGTKEVWLFQHENCGAYGLPEDISHDEEMEVHQKDLKKMEDLILEKVDKNIRIKKFFVTLTDQVIRVND